MENFLVLIFFSFTFITNSGTITISPAFRVMLWLASSQYALAGSDFSSIVIT
ncbi:hypothetical protein QWY99_11875 [Flavobacterium branchiarum]|uniref:hypothetical protein n=1 Tax=Flavobacterium branchiarum TaxID=1114870 RepID=UPI0025B29D11|nr:hypothetical protein [Flavobacterium branchiarum]MDN3673752.1 hypothetical protein [Flavobacterium branchiarum]